MKRIYILLSLVFCLFPLLGISQNLNLMLFEKESFRDSLYAEMKVKKHFDDSLAVHNFLDGHLEMLLNDSYVHAGFDSVIYRDSNILAYLTRGRKYEWGKLRYTCEAGTNPAVHALQRRYRRDYEGQAVQVDVLREIHNIAAGILRKNGAAFANCSIDSLGYYSGAVHVFLDITNNTMYYLDSIEIRGYRDFPEYYLRKKLFGSRVLHYSKAKMADIPGKMANIPFVQLKTNPGVKFSDSTYTPVLQTEKKASSDFFLLLGILPTEDASQKLRFSGEARFDVINFLGQAEHMQFTWKRPEESSQELDIGYEHPYIAGSDLGADLAFQLEKVDSSYLRLRGEGRMKYYFSDAAIGLGLERRQVSDISSASSDLADVNSWIYHMTYSLDKRDYRQNPRKGYILNLKAGGGSRDLANSEAGVEIQDNAILEASFSGAFFIPLFKRWTLKLWNNSSGIQAQDLYKNELYRVGGINSMRGYDENALLASSYVFSGMELRYLFEENASVYVFSDIGWLEECTINTYEQFLPLSVGIGTFFRTGLGRFSINFALGKNPESGWAWNASKVHLSYSNAF